MMGLVSPALPGRGAGRWRLGGGPALVTLVAAILLAGLATAASAHTVLESSVPADGTTVDVAPSSVELVFSQAPLGVSGVTVTGPGGASATSGAASQDGPKVVAPLGALPGSGVYTVAWEIVAADGHPLSGTTSFTFNGPPPATSPAVQASVALRAATTPAPGPTESGSGSEDNRTRDISDTTTGGIIVLAVLVALFLVIRRLRRRG